MIETCDATTSKGTRCKRERVEGHSFCAMHLRIAQEAMDVAVEQVVRDDLARARRPHGEGPGDTSLVADLAIRDSDDQPPAVLVVMLASESVLVDGWTPTDAELSRMLADMLAANGGTEADLDALIEEGVVDDWARGYWRSIQAA